MCFEKLDMMKKAKMKKINTACLSAVFEVHRSNRIVSLLQHDNAA